MEHFHLFITIIKHICRILSLQGIVTLNNVRFHKQKTGIYFIGGGGIGASWYNTKVNALNGSSTYASLFTSVYNSQTGGAVYSNRKDVIKQLKAGMDNTYETAAENEGAHVVPNWETIL